MAVALTRNSLPKKEHSSGLSPPSEYNGQSYVRALFPPFLVWFSLLLVRNNRLGTVGGNHLIFANYKKAYGTRGCGATIGDCVCDHFKNWGLWEVIQYIQCHTLSTH
jgi:hypothetical protein